jgi:hypothetical protein
MQIRQLEDEEEDLPLPDGKDYELGQKHEGDLKERFLFWFPNPWLFIGGSLAP